MRNLTELTPNERGNTTISGKADFTPFELAEIQSMQAKIYDSEEVIDWGDGDED